MNWYKYIERYATHMETLSFEQQKEIEQYRMKIAKQITKMFIAYKPGLTIDELEEEAEKISYEIHSKKQNITHILNGFSCKVYWYACKIAVLRSNDLFKRAISRESQVELAMQKENHKGHTVKVYQNNLQGISRSDFASDSSQGYFYDSESLLCLAEQNILIELIQATCMERNSKYASITAEIIGDQLNGEDIGKKYAERHKLSYDTMRRQKHEASKFVQKTFIKLYPELADQIAIYQRDLELKISAKECSEEEKQIIWCDYQAEVKKPGPVRHIKPRSSKSVSFKKPSHPKRRVKPGPPESKK